MNNKRPRASNASSKNNKEGYVSNKFASMVVSSFLSILACTSILLLTSCSTPPTRTANNQMPANRSTTANLGNAPYTSAITGFKAVDWQQISGWQTDDFTQAWPAWLKSCEALRKRKSEVQWAQVCAKVNGIAAEDGGAIRRYFETNFQAYETSALSNNNNSGLVTGYYEPVMNGSRQRTAVFSVPLYAYPKAWEKVKPNPAPTRAQLMSTTSLTGSELAWVQDPVAAAFMQIQGSGKIRLNDGQVLRLGFAGTNDQPFKSFAQWLLNQGYITRSEATMQGIQQWARNNPNRVEEMLNANPRFVFFKILPSNVAADLGPIGALGVPLTAERSIAVDLRALPLGAPVFLSTTRPLSTQILQRLVMAQDTGTAIVGAVRADYYWGSGEAAGELAGRMKQAGQAWLLLPR